MNAYIKDILTQPDALIQAINLFDPSVLGPIRTRLIEGEFDRIIISGMGASYNAAVPAYIHLTKLEIPVILVNAAELLHYTSGLIGEKTLLWLNSQSGKSVELVNLINAFDDYHPANLIVSVNDTSSPLANAADVILPIHAGEEATVSVKTYSNMLAINLLAALTLTGESVDIGKSMLLTAAKRFSDYLKDWDSLVEHLDSLLGEFSDLYILGRGPSMSTVWNGALISKEASKSSFEGMHAADFRHGPLELVEPGLCAFIFAGNERTKENNRLLAQDIDQNGGKVIWVDSISENEFPGLVLPDCDPLALPLLEIIPMQILTVVMAKRKGIEPGVFRLVGKITTTE